jgi:hypothetical protein
MRLGCGGRGSALELQVSRAHLAQGMFKLLQRWFGMCYQDAACISQVWSVASAQAPQAPLLAG